MATYPNNPLPWKLESGRWIDADGDLIPFSPNDERLMFNAHIQTLKDELHYEKARVGTAEHCVSDLNAKLNETKRNEARLSNQVGVMREAIEQIQRMAEVRGRWLDDETGDCVSAKGHDEHEEDAVPEEPATWTPYDLDEQNAAMEAIAERAFAALESTKAPD